MAKKRLPMRKVREVLRLKYEGGLSQREIGLCLKVGKTTVRDYLRRAESACLSWPLPKDLDDETLEKRLFATEKRRGRPPRAEALDYEWIDREMRKKGVTLTRLWYEYRQANPRGLQYSQFSYRYRSWKKRNDLVMRQQHKGGEKMFVDYAGQTVPVRMPGGKAIKAQIFVAVLGASNYTYAEATESQELENWIGSHERAFAYFGGVASLVVPDNLKSGVDKPSRYEPEINASYEEMARHYQTAIMPARVRKPKDKAKVETGVQLVERWILAALRHESFDSLQQLNQGIAHLLERLNEKPFKKLSGSRRSRFLEIEVPCLKPLPKQPYELSHWALSRVGLDYHVEIQGHFYSVPHRLAGKEVDVRYTQKCVEIFRRNKRVAVHAFSKSEGEATTCRAHMPKRHRAIAEWTPQKAKQWAQDIGRATQGVVDELLKRGPHRLISLRSIAGLVSLAHGFGEQRLEAACLRARIINGYSYNSIKSILKNRLDQQPISATENEEDVASLSHGNIRGATYYTHQEEDDASTPYS